MFRLSGSRNERTQPPAGNKDIFREWCRMPKAQAEKVRAIIWEKPVLRLIDQRKLPAVREYVLCRTADEVADAIRSMVVRGAPAIGATAAYGIAMGAAQLAAKEKAAGSQTAGSQASDRAGATAHGADDALDGVGETTRAEAEASPNGGDETRQGADRFWKGFQDVCERMGKTRPTAVNLFWAIDRMSKRAAALLPGGPSAVVNGLEAEADAIAREDAEINRRIGSHGAAVVGAGDGILTHCNTGSLATFDYGTAIGVIRAAHEQGKEIRVFADETRPFLQGARLTAWELMQDDIPVTLITDNMAGYVMSKGLVQLVVVGADRVAANGDVVNKIGTYSVAVLAKAHGIPFYAAAPLSTIDLNVKTGNDVTIEERNTAEVTHVLGTQIAPDGVEVINPAFDVTPHEYVAGIITEKGIIRPPFAQNLRRLFA